MKQRWDSARRIDFTFPGCSVILDLLSGTSPTCISVLVLKVWSTDQQHENLLGTCHQCRISALLPDLLNQNLHFNETPPPPPQAIPVHTE